MRIAVVINTSWNIYNFRKGLISALLKDGHELYAIAPEDNYSPKLEELGVHYIPLEMNAKGMNPIKDYLLMRRLRKCYREHRIDLALHYTIKPNLYGSWGCRNISTKAINNVSGLGTMFIRDNIVSKIVKVLYKATFKFASKVFFQNKEDLTLFLEHNLVDPSKTGLLPGSGIDFKVIDYQPKQDLSNEVKFLFPARVLIDKGVREFLEAGRLIKEKYGERAKFVMCGKPEANPSLGLGKKQIEGFVQNFGFEYLGHVDNLVKVMQEMDCVVLPSYREGTPRVLLEASCAGVFMITTDAPGCREVVTHERNGLLCDVKDVKSLYNCMEMFLDIENSSRLTMLETARNWVEEKFDERIVIEEYRKAIALLN